MPQEPDPSPPHLLIFGSTGAIGNDVASAATGRNWKVTLAARRAGPGVISVDPFDQGFLGAASFPAGSRYTAVCWAQGANLSDTIFDIDLERHMQTYQANVVYILMTLKTLLDGDLLAPGSRLCVISSIWQRLARQSKLSYCVTKAALQGLVLSASADLARDGHLINAVLPGALDTPMTRSNLSAQQLDRFSNATQFDRLATLGDVSSLVLYLCSPENTGITGQFICADLGFSHVRII